MSAQKQGDEEDIGAKSKEVTDDWRKLYSEDLHDLYSSPNCIKLRSARYMARMGRREMHTGFW